MGNIKTTKCRIVVLYKDQHFNASWANLTDEELEITKNFLKKVISEPVNYFEVSNSFNTYYFSDKMLKKSIVSLEIE